MKKIIGIGILLILSTQLSIGQGWNVFVPQNGSFVKKNINLKVQSINIIAKYLGYNTDQIESYYDGEDDKISMVVFKVFTNDIIFVLAHDSVANLSAEWVEDYLWDYDFNEVYDSYKREGILTNGIKNKSFTVDFLAKVLNEKSVGPNGLMLAKSIGYNLQFKDGFLVKFNSFDGLNKWARSWKLEQNETYSSYENAAQKYWQGNNEKILNEINIQADAWSRTPEAARNEYIKFHRTMEGTINYKMLLVAHYNDDISLKTFKEINFGRYELVDEFTSSDNYKRTTYKVDEALYTFSEEGKIVSSYTTKY